MRAYSLDLRERVVRAIGVGKPQREVAQTFGISIPTVQRWVRLDKQQALAPKVIPGRQPYLGPGQEPLLRAQVEAHPDAILDEHIELWEASQGQRFSRPTMWRALKRLGYTRKKSV